ncbi:MAG: hypothetical protein CSH37_14030 [Thalassolituus sp.]|nr:MAG: hypothetical protein CSH37_14030 [Thalassolituus sp.]
MNQIERIRRRLTELMQDKRITETELAQRSGVAQSTVNRILSGKIPDPKIGTLDRLARNVGTTLESILIELESQPGQICEPSVEYNLLGMTVYSLKDIDRETTLDIEVQCPFPHSRNTYAVYIDGDPATANPMQPSFGRAYPVGSIIFADPDQCDDCENGDIVLAELIERPSKVTAFRQLYKEAGSEALRPLNPQFPMIIEPFRIVAKVIGAILPV